MSNLKRPEKPGKRYVWHVLYVDGTYTVHTVHATRQEAYAIAATSDKRVKKIWRREVTE